MILSEVSSKQNVEVGTAWQVSGKAVSKLAENLQSAMAQGDTVDISEDAKKKWFEDADSQLEQLQKELEASNQQADAMSEAMESMGKILTIMRRIMNGDQVPASDEKKLIEYDPGLYQIAKSMAAMNAHKSHKKYDALFKDEDEKQSDGNTEESGASGSSEGNGTEAAVAACENAVMSDAGEAAEGGPQ